MKSITELNKNFDNKFKKEWNEFYSQDNEIMRYKNHSLNISLQKDVGLNWWSFKVYYKEWFQRDGKEYTKQVHELNYYIIREDEIERLYNLINNLNKNYLSILKQIIKQNKIVESLKSKLNNYNFDYNIHLHLEREELTFTIKTSNYRFEIYNKTISKLSIESIHSTFLTMEKLNDMKNKINLYKKHLKSNL